MVETTLLFILSGSLILTPVPVSNPVSLKSEMLIMPAVSSKILLSRGILDMGMRNPDKNINEIFKDNILLNLHYMKGDADAVKKYHGEEMIDWEKVLSPFEFSLNLPPDELFAFHDEILPEFAGKKVKTGWTKFSVAERYKVMDGLSGDGVCHLATLINMVSSQAGLSVTAKVSHDFAPVFGIDPKYGTSIVYLPHQETTKRQNLYVLNPYPFQVTFHFISDSGKVELIVEK